MQAPIVQMKRQSDVTLNRDQSRDLFVIGHCATFKHGAQLLAINIVSILIEL
jgi:hypothetical protein